MDDFETIIVFENCFEASLADIAAEMNLNNKTAWKTPDKDEDPERHRVPWLSNNAGSFVCERGGGTAEIKD